MVAFPTETGVIGYFTDTYYLEGMSYRPMGAAFDIIAHEYTHAVSQMQLERPHLG